MRLWCTKTFLNQWLSICICQENKFQAKESITGYRVKIKKNEYCYLEAIKDLHLDSDTIENWLSRWKQSNWVSAMAWRGILSEHSSPSNQWPYEFIGVCSEYIGEHSGIIGKWICGKWAGNTCFWMTIKSLKCYWNWIRIILVSLPTRKLQTVLAKHACRGWKWQSSQQLWSSLDLLIWKQGKWWKADGKKPRIVKPASECLVSHLQHWGVFLAALIPLIQKD